MGRVLELFDNSKALESLIHAIAKNSSSVHIPNRGTGHILGDVSTSQIFCCLEMGSVTQVRDEPDKHGFKSCGMTYFTAGQEVSIVLSVDTDKRELHILHVE